MLRGEGVLFIVVDCVIDLSGRSLFLIAVLLFIAIDLSIVTLPFTTQNYGGAIHYA
jgi:hypothetical protein